MYESFSDKSIFFPLLRLILLFSIINNSTFFPDHTAVLGPNVHINMTDEKIVLDI